MVSTQKINNVLWFESDGEAAANHYIKGLKDGRIVHIARYGKDGPGPEGSVMLVAFELAGQKFAALNGGPLFKPNESVSFLIECEDQAEVDRLWAHMSEGGSTSACGWLKDRWGFSWQIVPRRMLEILQGPDGAAKSRAFSAMMQMTKLDIVAIEKAYAGS
jgi:predicted 3-demethylubiquinone-9 3-methyltransferase (glyoxalase superfamily)